MNLHYNHVHRTIVDDSGKYYSYEDAMDLFNQGAVSDTNIAFTRLVKNGGDMDATDEEYRQLESRKDPVDLVNELFEKHKDCFNGSFHTLLWQVIVNECTKGSIVAFALHQNHDTLEPILAEEVGGYRPAICYFRDELTQLDIDPIIADLNMQIFGYDEERAEEIFLRSLGG